MQGQSIIRLVNTVEGSGNKMKRRVWSGNCTVYGLVSTVNGNCKSEVEVECEVKCSAKYSLK